MIFDTSVLIGLVDAKDSLATEARGLYDEFGPGQIQQTAVTEFEAAFFGRARLSVGHKEARKEARRAMRLLLEVLGFRVVPVSDMGTALELYHAHEALSFVDACGVADADALHDLVTFDEDQKDALRTKLGLDPA